jgi:hypothetical protein
MFDKGILVQNQGNALFGVDTEMMVAFRTYKEIFLDFF